MCDIICVTNRLLCKDNFLERIEKIAANDPYGIILREKDLSPDDYMLLAKKAVEIGNRYDTRIILHSFPQAAAKLGCSAVHLPLDVLKSTSPEALKKFKTLGTSCHSVQDAVEAEALGCTYIIAGHIFATDCKKGVPPRGLEFLSSVCKAVSIPVWAIGGITPKKIPQIKACGAKGGCIMSGLMECENVEEYLKHSMP